MSKLKRQGGAKGTTAQAGELLVSGHVLAALYGVTLRTVQNWRNELGLPATGRDQYNLRQVIGWREQRLRVELSAAAGDEKRLVKAQADERAAKARMAEMDQRRRAGELLERAAVERERLERIVAVKTGLRNLEVVLGRRLADVHDPGEIERRIAVEVESCLRRFCDDGELAAAEQEWIELWAFPLSRHRGLRAMREMLKTIWNGRQTSSESGAQDHGQETKQYESQSENQRESVGGPDGVGKGSLAAGGGGLARQRGKGRVGNAAGRTV